MGHSFILIFFTYMNFEYFLNSFVLICLTGHLMFLWGNNTSLIFPLFPLVSPLVLIYFSSFSPFVLFPWELLSRLPASTDSVLMIFRSISLISCPLFRFVCLTVCLKISSGCLRHLKLNMSKIELISPLN